MATVGFNDSILSSIKMLMPNTCIPADYDVFDVALIGYINSTLSVVSQLGVGKPDEVFFITGTGETWDQYLGSTELLSIVPIYVAMRVKLLFDPPTQSSVMEQINKEINELGFRLQDAARRANKQEEL